MEGRYLFIIFLLFLLLAGGYWLFWRKPKEEEPEPLPEPSRSILRRKVLFYRQLDAGEKERFERQVQRFLRQVRITGVETKVTDTDRLLVAASAVIPVFGFPQWKGYPNLREVLLYPDTFDDDDFSVEGEDRDTLGLVGWDELNDQMILSQPALRLGFEPDADINVGIHEFAHLLDMVDGATDGVPELLLDPAYIPSWLELVDREIEAIRLNKSVLPEYGGADAAEFFAVAAEYFFQRPRYLKHRHPELFRQLQRIFRQDMDIHRS